MKATTCHEPSPGVGHPTRKVPGLWFLESSSHSIFCSPHLSLFVGNAHAMKGDVFVTRLDVAPVLFTFVAMKVGCRAIRLHMASCAALPTVLIDTSEAFVECSHAMVLEIAGNLQHALTASSLTWVSAERDLEGTHYRATRVIRGGVGITVFKCKLFYEAPEADLLVSRHHPVTFVARHDLSINVADDCADRVHVESNRLGLEVVLVVSNVMTEDYDGIVTLESFRVLDRLDEEVGEYLTSFSEGNEAAFAKPISIDAA